MAIAFLGGNIEIDAHEDAFTGDFQIADRELGHKEKERAEDGREGGGMTSGEVGAVESSGSQI
jgi:hypothetical protein